MLTNRMMLNPKDAMKSPAFSILAGALLSALIIISVVVGITAITAGVTGVIVFYTYRFATRQIIAMKTFALGYLKIIMKHFNKILKTAKA